jgi:Ca2+/H+ antiporter, TMEM165/GDT1 family
MDWKIFGSAFITLLLAELGDKTQLAVITMTASTESKLSVFIGASLALVVVTALGVLIGGVLSACMDTDRVASADRCRSVYRDRCADAVWKALGL